MALADGSIEPAEKEMLATFAQRRNVPPSRTRWHDCRRPAGTDRSACAGGSGEARQWLQTMAEEAMADGKISREELVLLESSGSRIGA